MSYKTNPIANRLTVNKGWKNPRFPTKILSYSREMVLWFKIYLLLKTYLSLYQIQLLACEIRISDTNTKLLYLSVNRISEKNNFYYKSKWEVKSLLQNSKSPLTKFKSKNARFLLYQDFKTLKHTSIWALNSWQKKVFSKTWISKNRISSWINTIQLIGRTRKHLKAHYIFNRQKKQRVKFVFSQNLVNVFQKKNIEQRIQSTFWNRKQKQILTFVNKLQKEITLFEKSLIFRSQNQTPKLTAWLSALFLTIETKKKALKKIRTLYKLLFHTSLDQNTLQNLHGTSKHIRKLRIQLQLKHFWIHFKRELLWKRRQSFFSKQKYPAFLLLKSRIFARTHNYTFPIPIDNVTFATSIQKLFSLYGNKLKGLIHELFLSPAKLRFRKKQIQRLPQKWRKKEKKVTALNNSYNIIKNVSKHRLFTLTQTHIFYQKKVPLTWQLERLIRFKQKRHPFLSQRKTNTTRHVFKTLRTDFQYRLPYKRIYKQNLTLYTNLRIKYLIQDFIQKYFSLHLHIKLIWPFIHFKTFKLYRLVLTQKKPSKSKRVLYLKQNSKNSFLHRRYGYTSHVTNHMQLQSFLSHTKQKEVTLKKLYDRIVASPHLQSKPRTSRLNSTTTQHMGFITINPQFWRKKTLAKNKYLLLKSKILEKRSQKNLHWASKATYMPELLSTLSLFAKYLEPQPLADSLAKIIGQTKRHADALKTVENVLRILKFKRAIGYRISLVGRINGANKSRAIYLTKFKRNRPRQTFSRKVNFAMAQARAQIGAFGIRIWIYH